MIELEHVYIGWFEGAPVFMGRRNRVEKTISQTIKATAGGPWRCLEMVALPPVAQYMDPTLSC